MLELHQRGIEDMKMGFQISEKPGGGGWKDLEHTLGQAFKNGVGKHGWDVECLNYIDDVTKFDVVGFIGVKNSFLAGKCDEERVPYIYFDKPYNRSKNWWKIAYGGHQPTKFLGKLKMPGDRRKAEGWEFKGWRKPTKNGHVLIAGSSLKYHVYHHLEHPTPYWQSIVDALGKITDRTVLYRPKKSWHDATKIPGADFSSEDNIVDDLRGAHAMVTYGSNSVMEAILAGIPSICLGDAVTAPLSSRTLNDVVNPKEANVEEIHALLNDLAYCQWRVEEINDGKFWSTLDGCLQISKAL